MIKTSSDDVRAFLQSYISERSEAEGRNITSDLADDCDLLLSGIIDSLGLLDLITAMGEAFGEHIDFESLDPEQMTIVGPLCSYVADQISTCPCNPGA